MAKAPTPEQWKTNAEAVSRAASRVATALPELAGWAKDVERGYPATSPGFADTHGAGTSDPTAAVALHEPDYPRQVAELGKKVDAVFRQLLVLDGLVQKMMPEEAVVGRQNSISRCVNCHIDCLPRAYAGRCRACYGYRNRTGRDRVVGHNGRAKTRGYERRKLQVRD